MHSIDIIYTSWPRSVERLAYFVVSVESLQACLKTQGVKVTWHVCIEQSEDLEIVRLLREFCERNEILTWFKHSPPSLSSMLNFANSVGNSKYMLFMQDDWQAIAKLHLATCLEHFEKFPEHDVIRLIHRPEFGVDGQRFGPFMELDPTKHMFYYADNPHIRRRSYLDHTGPFPNSVVDDGTDQGRCENAMNGMAKKLAITTGAHKILSVMTRNFAHIGDKNTTLTEKRFDR